MNRIKSLISLFCGAALMVGCQQEDIVHSNINGDFANITIEADYPDTRTYINESAGRVEWSSNDQIVVFENNNYSNSTKTTINNSKATFSVSFIKDSSTSTFNYNALYPLSSFVEASGCERVQLSLPAQQSASASSFDAKADILIAKQQTKGAQATSLSMQFKRLVAMAKLSFKGLPSNTKISEVTFTANGKALAGKCIVNLSKGEVIEKSNYSKEESINVKYDQSISASTPIYFNCYPTTIGSGETFSVTVTTDNGSSYTKSVTLAAGKSLRFEDGDLSTFTVDMSGISADEPTTTYKIGDLYNENGNKGLVFAFSDKKMFNAEYDVIGHITYGYIMSLDEGYAEWSTENIWTNCYSSGAINTETMVSLGIDKYPAAKWCVEHGEGWFMPTATEMTWMWDTLTDGEKKFDAPSVAKYNKLFTDNGGDEIEEAFYWTSSEIDDSNAETFAFLEKSYICDEPYKYKKRDVRAVYMFEVSRTYYE